MVAVSPQLPICHVGWVAHWRRKFVPPKLPGCFRSIWRFLFQSPLFSSLQDQPQFWLRAHVWSQLELLFDIVPSRYHIDGIKCPYWFFSLIGPTWNRICFVNGTSCGLQYETCFNKPLLTGISPREASKDNSWIPSGTVTLLSPPSGPLAFPPPSPKAYKQTNKRKTPKQYSPNSQIIPRAPDSDRTESLWLPIEWRVLEGSTTWSRGSENPKDAAVLRFFVFGSPFKLPKGIN